MTALPPIVSAEWVVGPWTDLRTGHQEVRVVTRMQRDGSRLYAVTQGGWVANLDAELEYERIPSSRDDDFIARCRFDDWEDAMRVAVKVLEASLSNDAASSASTERGDA